MNCSKSACLLVALLAVQCLTGCSTIRYYSESVAGQWQVMTQRQEIDQLLKNGTTPSQLRDKLQLATALRQFAITELGLPDNGSYQHYVDIQRPFVVWNVFATPELSLEPHISCFPFAGCLAYRGFFSKQSADAYARDLESQAMDTFVGGVSAYSTLGWFRDPILSSMLNWSDNRLAEVIFHELAHQKLYVEDDTDFNEAYAMVVGSYGVQRWLQQQADQSLSREYAVEQMRNRAFVSLILDFRQQLDALFSSQLNDDQKLAEKKRLYADLQAAYERLKESWQGYSGYDQWMHTGLNNAKLLSVSTYESLTDAFKALMGLCEDELACYYRETSKLGQIAKPERHDCLLSLIQHTDMEWPECLSDKAVIP